jgi:hypothetical protein
MLPEMAEPFTSISALIRVVAEVVRALPSVFTLGSVVSRHNREVERIYEDTTSWAHDELRKEAQAIQGVYMTEEGRPTLMVSQTGQVTRIRGDFAERWRNRERQTKRDIEDLRDRENPLHRLYRKLRHRPWPHNPDQEEVDRITAEWRNLAGS